MICIYFDDSLKKFYNILNILKGRQDIKKLEMKIF